MKYKHFLRKKRKFLLNSIWFGQRISVMKVFFLLHSYLPAPKIAGLHHTERAPSFYYKSKKKRFLLQRLVVPRLIYTGWSTSARFLWQCIEQTSKYPLFLHGVTSSAGRKICVLFHLTKSISLLSISMYQSYSTVTVLLWTKT